MNLARKKLSEESSENSLIINTSNSKSIKDTINQQIVESLDVRKETSTTIKDSKISKKNKNSTKNQTNNQEQKTDLITSSVNEQLNITEEKSTTKKNKKKVSTKPENAVSQETIETSEKLTNNIEMESLHLQLNDHTNLVNTAMIKPVEISTKSKAELKAERRALQEAQRALKAQKKEAEKKEKPPAKKPPLSKPKPKPAEPKKPEPICEKKIPKKVEHYVTGVFSHLTREESLIENSLNSDIHPMFVKLGVKYAEGKAVGSNCRCEAFLFALRRFIKVYEAPEQQDFVRGLEVELNKTVEFLNRCRPLSVTMQNALKRIRGQMSLVKSTESDEEVRKMLRSTLLTYINEQILLAGKAICRKMLSRINDGDVILTYGHSTLVRKVLCNAQENGKKFRVIVVDSRPRLEGKFLISKLVEKNIDCTYIMLNALSFVLPKVTMVVMGAYSILANGAIMARVGTAQVALMSKDSNIPVIILSEMNKCDDRALTDSIVFNELDNSDALVKTFDDSKYCPLGNWRSKKTLNLLNLAYDVTPASFITTVITELAIMPCKSIPVALRVKPWEV